MRIAQRVRIKGRVQGVFYRAWTHEQAGKLGVAGWIRNCDDGSVEAHIEGEYLSVRRLFDRLAKGPANAKVKTMFAEPVELEGFGEFTIKH